MSSVDVYRFGLIAVLLSLTGCATQAQKQSKTMETQWEHAASEQKLCKAELERSDAHQRIKDILILKPNDPNAVTKMTIERYATKQEKENLLAWNQHKSTCNKQFIENLGDVHLEFAMLAAKWSAEDDALLVHILKDKLTLGGANEVRHTRFSERNAQGLEVGKRVDQQFQNAHQSEMQRRQEAAATMQQWSYQQQLLEQNRKLLNSANSPTTTNCRSLGNTINCTSY